MRYPARKRLLLRFSIGRLRAQAGRPLLTQEDSVRLMPAAGGR